MSEFELIALVRRPEAERGIEAVRIGAALVRGQLDKAAAAPPAFLDCPFEHRPAGAGAALGPGDPHTLDLAAPHAAPCEAGAEAQLQATNHLSPALGHNEQLVGVALDRGEGGFVAGVESWPAARAP